MTADLPSPSVEGGEPYRVAVNDDLCTHPEEQRRTQVIEEPTIYEVCSGCEHVLAIRTGARAGAVPADLDALLHRLIVAPAEHVAPDWPFDYEQGLCFWCGKHLAHADDCPWMLASARLGHPGESPE